MDLGLKGKVVVVTGGGGSIGEAIERTFAEECSKIVVAEIDEAAGRHAVDALKSLGVDALFVKADITRVEGAIEMAKAAADKFGTVDVLVNNAAVAPEAGKLFMEQSVESRIKEANVIFHGYINCIRAALDYMMKQNKGSIVSILTDAARVGETRMVTYGAAKAGVAGFSRGIAKEVARYNIRVNCVSPSMTVTVRMQEIFEAEKAKLGDEKQAQL